MSFYGSANKPTYAAKLWIQADNGLLGKASHMNSKELETFIRREFHSHGSFGSVKTADDLNRINFAELAQDL